MFNKANKNVPDPNRWAKFVMGSTVCRWTRPDGKERVYLIARNDGGFSYGYEQFSDAEFERCWVSVGAGGNIFGSEQIAIREINADFAWTRDVVREDNV